MVKSFLRGSSAQLLPEALGRSVIYHSSNVLYAGVARKLFKRSSARANSSQEGLSFARTVEAEINSGSSVSLIVLNRSSENRLLVHGCNPFGGAKPARARRAR